MYISGVGYNLKQTAGRSIGVDGVTKSPLVQARVYIHISALGVGAIHNKSRYSLCLMHQ